MIKNTPYRRPLAVLAVPLFVVGAAGLGCHGHKLNLAIPGETARVTIQEQVLDISVQGREIRALIFNPGDDPPFLVFAAIHGNEIEAQVLAGMLEERWKENPAVLRGAHVVLVPSANPDGAALGTRYNANGVDLNRNFPAGWERKERGGLPFTRLMPRSEPETRAIFNLVEEIKPYAIISVHSCQKCNGMNNYDGPALEYAKVMEQRNGYPASSEWLTATPGSFGTWAGKSNQIPTVTLELPSPPPFDSSYEMNVQAVEAAILYQPD